MRSAEASSRASAPRSRGDAGELLLERRDARARGGERAAAESRASRPRPTAATHARRERERRRGAAHGARGARRGAAARRARARRGVCPRLARDLREDAARAAPARARPRHAVGERVRDEHAVAERALALGAAARADAPRPAARPRRESPPSGSRVARSQELRVVRHARPSRATRSAAIARLIRLFTVPERLAGLGAISDCVSPR